MVVMNINKNKMKGLWDNCVDHQQHSSHVFLWPPSSYTCTFCKREFKSAQALGGHMNVHRRDRARLRQISPPKDGPPDQISKENPNLISFSKSPNLSSSLSSSRLSSPSRKCPPSRKEGVSQMSHTVHKGQDFGKINRGTKRGFELEKLRTCNVNHQKAEIEIVRLELQIGVLGHQEQHEDLDLELRLGYA